MSAVQFGSIILFVMTLQFTLILFRIAKIEIRVIKIQKKLGIEEEN